MAENKTGISMNKRKTNKAMNIKNILFLGVALWVATPAFSAPADNNDDGAKQTLTINEETDSRTVSEIKMDGNNAVLTFTDGTTLAVDMRLVSLTMSYDEATRVDSIENGELRIENSDSWYTLDGIKVTVMPKQNGIYIHNGKKVVNKK